MPKMAIFGSEILKSLFKLCSRILIFFMIVFFVANSFTLAKGM